MFTNSSPASPNEKPRSRDRGFLVLRDVRALLGRNHPAGECQGLTGSGEVFLGAKLFGFLHHFIELDRRLILPNLPRLFGQDLRLPQRLLGLLRRALKLCLRLLCGLARLLIEPFLQLPLVVQLSLEFL